MIFFIKLPGYAFLLMRKFIERCIMLILKPLFKACGRNVRFSPWDIFSFSTISIGDDVYIGPGARFSAIKGITIGNKVLFGPHVFVSGGNHNTSKIGSYMYDVKEKRPEDDQPIVIEDDVWVGGRAIILKGVTVGRGSIIGAGAIVTKDVPPYCIVAGMPAKVIRLRFDIETIKAHEEKIGYSPSQKLSDQVLAKLEDLNNGDQG